MEQVRQQNKLEKERGQLLQRKVVKERPNTRRGLLEQGYQFVGNAICMCGRAFEWWRTPNQRQMPYEPMPTIDSAAVTHFKYCKRAFETKWKRRAA